MAVILFWCPKCQEPTVDICACGKCRMGCCKNISHGGVTISIRKGERRGRSH